MHPITTSLSRNSYMYWDMYVEFQMKWTLSVINYLNIQNLTTWNQNNSKFTYVNFTSMIGFLLIQYQIHLHYYLNKRNFFLTENFFVTWLTWTSCTSFSSSCCRLSVSSWIFAAPLASVFSITLSFNSRAYLNLFWPCSRVCLMAFTICSLLFTSVSVDGISWHSLTCAPGF